MNRLVFYPDATQRIIGMPEVGEFCAAAGERAGESIVAAVPVVRGVMAGTYNPSAEPTSEGARLTGFGSFWHWMEYGTRYSPAYRPIMRGCEAAGLRFEPH